MAFRNARLTAELSGAGRTARPSHTHELAESRRRLISAGDAERSRLERAIARQVIPHLAAAARTGCASCPPLDPHGTAALDAASLEPLVESLNTALEALREITRGRVPRPARPLRAPHGARVAARPDRQRRSAGRSRTPPSAGASTRASRPRPTSAWPRRCATSEAPCVVVLDARADQLQLTVSGTDGGGLPLSHMRDRVEAAGGSVSITEDGGRAVIEVRAPPAVRRGAEHAAGEPAP